MSDSMSDLNIDQIIEQLVVRRIIDQLFAPREVCGLCRSVIQYYFWKAGKIVVSLILKPVEKWERAFLVSCIAVSLDPLFLYIPIVDETNKCLAMDKTLRTTVLIFRSLTDFLLLAHIVAQIRGRVNPDYKIHTDYEIPPQLGDKPGSHKEFDSGSKDDSDHRFFVVSLIIIFLAVLPIPQVAILVEFFRMGGAGIKKFLNMSLILQYLPRVFQIHRSRSKFSMPGKWTNPAYNLFLYILASHVLGALWYFFAIERETSCWHRACEKTAGCIASAYKCGASSFNASSKNIPMLNQLCPITSPNATEFDFGIFLKVLQSGTTGSVDFPAKIFYTLWWGLKNLSNFGTSLETSSYLWENCFAILICVIGLLLFLYLIGNMQVYMQSETTNKLEYEKLKQIKIAKNKGEIVKWMKDNKLRPDTMEAIKTAIKEHKVLEKKLVIDVDVKYFLDEDVSIRIKQPILENLGLALLQSVPLFTNIPDDKLRSLCQHMNPVTYTKNAALANDDQPLEQMIFIIRGEIEFVPAGPSYCRRERNFELLTGSVLEKWVAFNFLKRSYCDPLPILAGGRVECCDPKVEGLALKTWDILRFAEQNFDVNSADLKKLAHAHSSTVAEIKEDPVIPDELWKPPAAGWVKLNCSYVWNPDSKCAAFGCVLRDDKGEQLNNVASVGSINNTQSTDMIRPGASSIRSLMKFSVQIVKTGRIIVESDDKCLIDFLEYWTSHPDDKRGRGILRPVLQEIASEVSKFKDCKFAHCERQANAAAVCVAEHAVHVSDVTETKTWKKDEEIPGLVDALKKDSPHLYESSREKELADRKVNVDTGSSTPAVGAPVSSEENNC